jgi:hypothetical protein
MATPATLGVKAIVGYGVKRRKGRVLVNRAGGKKQTGDDTFGHAFSTK